MSHRHLIVLGIRGVPAQHGGFESFAEQLVPWMVKAGWRVTVYCQGSDSGKKYTDEWRGCRRIHIPVHGNSAISTIEFDLKSTIDAIRQKGTILTLGYNTGFLCLLTKLFGVKNIVNMDGIEWKRAKYSNLQKFYLWINERLAAFFADHLIADHPKIGEHLVRHTKPDKITMIPYGANAIREPKPILLDTFGLEPFKYMSVIARPEPENSILQIVRAFSSEKRDIKLLILGNYSKNIDYQNRVLNSASDEVIFPGAIYNEDEVSTIRYYSLAYVHGHQVGGTNPSLVEALGASRPIIAHDNHFNRWVAGNAAIYFSDEAECSQCITELSESKFLQDQLSAFARNRWVETFTWESVLETYQNTITEISAKN